MKKGLLIAILAIVIVANIVFLIFNISKYIDFGSWFGSKECKVESDCVKVQIDCCPCNTGGEEKCVPASQAGAYRAEVEKCPKELFCPAVDNCKIKKCTCEKGKCQ